MLNVFAAIGLAMLALASTPARAQDDAIVAAVNEAAEALDKAFERQDAKAIYDLVTPDHVAVTPYYDGPQSVSEQIESLPELKYDQENLGEPQVTLLAEGVALRTFSAELTGSYQGRPIPSPVYVMSLMVKDDSGWKERFYQVTALAHDRSGRFRPCRGFAGVYLTKNTAKGQASGFTSRSLITFARGGQVAFTDSGEAGEAGYRPFSEGHGVWECVTESGPPKAKAILLDFTFSKTEESAAQIGRLDLDVTYDEGTALKGTATLRLVPLASDPLQAQGLGEGRQFDIEGVRVDLPGVD